MVESFKFQGNSKVYKFNCVITIIPINQRQHICVCVNGIGVTSLKATSATRLYKDLDIPDTWELIQR